MIFWFFLYLILAQKKLEHQMLKNSDVQHILWSVFSDLLFFLKYFSILNTMQAGKRKALKVTIPAEVRLPLQIYFFFCAFWSSQEYKEEKTHIFHFSSARFLLWSLFIKKRLCFWELLGVWLSTPICVLDKRIWSKLWMFDRLKGFEVVPFVWTAYISNILIKDR